MVESTAIPTWSTVGNRAGCLLHRLRDSLGGDRGPSRVPPYGGGGGRGEDRLS